MTQAFGCIFSKEENTFPVIGLIEIFYRVRQIFSNCVYSINLPISST